MIRFYLGTHQPHWLARADEPLFVSARRLRKLVALPRAKGVWALDSGGFSELQLHGRWVTDAMTYASEVRRWSDAVGGLAWAAAQDWMCEPLVIQGGTVGKLPFAGTKLSVSEHQRLTVANYLLLRQLAPDLPWAPVIQGYTLAQYRDCINRYADAGVALTALPIVGVGSICRRQATEEAAEILRFVTGYGIKAHAFGLKLGGLKKVAHLLEGADSMAWSFQARRRPPMQGHTHANCANCLPYALAWRRGVLEAIGQPKQLTMF